MGNFTEIETEFNNEMKTLLNSSLSQAKISNEQIIFGLYQLRMKYIKKLHDKTGRNIIVYYSAWQQGNTIQPNPEVMINDNDMNGFMNSINKLDRKKGLDLILHTPGGVTTATESIVNYLRKCFKNNIRVIVPHMAMSAGTMIACSAKQILMGKQSSLGPIDPQFRNVPAEGVIEEFKQAMTETLKEPNRSLIWREIIKQYIPAFIGECENVIKLSCELVNNWLKTGMFKKDKNKAEKISTIIKELASHKNSKVHDRHYDSEQCKKLGLKIYDIEKDQELQDIILSIHHSHILSIIKIESLIKIIENHDGQIYATYGKR